MMLGADRIARLVVFRGPHAGAMHGALLLGHQLAAEDRLLRRVGRHCPATGKQQGAKQRGQSHGPSEHDRLLDYWTAGHDRAAARLPPTVTCRHYRPARLNRT